MEKWKNKQRFSHFSPSAWKTQKAEFSTVSTATAAARLYFKEKRKD
jgi:hypothetical protein